MGMGGNGNSTFSHKQRRSPSVLHPGTSADSDTLDCHSPPAKKRRVFDFKDLCDPEGDQQHGRNDTGRVCQSEWECEQEEMGITNGNGNKNWLNLGSGMEMGMNNWEWEGMGLNKTFPHMSTLMSIGL